MLRALTTKFPHLGLPDFEDLEVARFCEARQDRPCHLRCPKPRAERAKSPGDGDNPPMGEEVAPTGPCGGDRATDVGPFPKAVEEMKVNKDRGLLPMVVPAFSPPLPGDPFSTCPLWRPIRRAAAAAGELRQAGRAVDEPDLQGEEDEGLCGRA